MSLNSALFASKNQQLYFKQLSLRKKTSLELWVILKLLEVIFASSF